MSVSNTCAQMFITLQLLLYTCTSIGTHSSRETACSEHHTVSRHTVHLYDNQTLLFPDANMLSELRTPLPWLFWAAQRQTDLQTGRLLKARSGQVRLLYTIYNLIHFGEPERSVPSIQIASATGCPEWAFSGPCLFNLEMATQKKLSTPKT